MAPNIPSEVIGVSEIGDKVIVPFIVVKKRAPDYSEKVVLKAGEGVSFRVIKNSCL